MAFWEGDRVCHCSVLRQGWGILCSCLRRGGRGEEYVLTLWLGWGESCHHIHSPSLCCWCSLWAGGMFCWVWCQEVGWRNARRLSRRPWSGSLFASHLIQVLWPFLCDIRGSPVWCPPFNTPIWLLCLLVHLILFPCVLGPKLCGCGSPCFSPGICVCAWRTWWKVVGMGGYAWGKCWRLQRSCQSRRWWIWCGGHHQWGAWPPTFLLWGQVMHHHMCLTFSQGPIVLSPFLMTTPAHVLFFLLTFLCEPSVAITNISSLLSTSFILCFTPSLCSSHQSFGGGLVSMEVCIEGWELGWTLCW